MGKVGSESRVKFYTTHLLDAKLVDTTPMRPTNMGIVLPKKE
jgi:hypothetical protein